jgi:hypothetical protein
MQTNTVQDLIDELKDLTGQTNLSDEKAVRALNRGTDRLSAIRLEIARKSGWDSRNQSDVSRVTTTTSDSKLELEDELVTLQELERLNADGTYTTLTAIDRRDSEYTTLKNQTGTPTAYDMDGRILRPLPVPDSSITYRLTYGRPHPRFTTDNLTQSTGVMQTEEEFIVFFAADRIMIGTNDPSRTQVRNELVVMERDIRKMAANVDQATPKRIKNKTMNHSNTFKRTN